jgi:hypothetical protein
MLMALVVVVVVVVVIVMLMPVMLVLLLAAALLLLLLHHGCLLFARSLLDVPNEVGDAHARICGVLRQSLLESLDLLWGEVWHLHAGHGHWYRHRAARPGALRWCLRH